MDDECINPSEESCPKCGNGMATRHCGACGGDGAIDVYEDDPINNAPDDMEECAECYGYGFHEWCQRCGWDVHMKDFLNGVPAIPLPEKPTCKSK